MPLSSSFLTQQAPPLDLMSMSLDESLGLKPKKAAVKMKNMVQPVNQQTVDPYANTINKKTGEINPGMIDVDGIIPPDPRKALRAETKPVPNDGLSITQVDGAMSMPIGEEFPTKSDGRKILDQMQQDKKEYNNAQMAIAGVQFMSEVFNANSAFASVQTAAQLNITQARNQAADTLYRGRKAQAEAESIGYQNADQARLSMAAQGQDVNGAGVDKIAGSYEAMGIYAGMQEEINSMREALGFELEEINYEHQEDAARTTRNFSMLGSALNFGAKAYGYSQGAI